MSIKKKKKHEHAFKYLNTSKLTRRNKQIVVDTYLCQICKKLYIVDTNSRKRVRLQGAIGEECK